MHKAPPIWFIAGIKPPQLVMPQRASEEFVKLFRVLYIAILAPIIVGCGSNESPQEAGKDAPALTHDAAFPKVVWDASLWGNPRAGTVAVDVLAREVEERTNGAWQINLHYGEAISKARENLDGIAIGAFEVAMVCNFYHPQKNPALMVLTMPFLPMETDAKSKAVREAVYAHPAVVAEFARWDAMLYTSTFLPQYEFMGRGEAPSSMADWVGMTVRAGGGIGDAMVLLGATPTSSTATEVYTGVQQGTMDAAAFPFSYSHVAYRIHEVSDWYTNGMAPGSADCPVVFSKTAYDKLPPQYHKVLHDVRSMVDAAQLQAYRDVDETNLPLLRNALLEVSFSPAMRNELRDSVGKRVIDEWIEENQDTFDARGLVELAFEAAGSTFK
ncbi:MAG: C4-dicarboxylate ABC transporter substrate-binding protein [Gammaproteobacteria bacterium]|nr:C4-dicarboxylate ABC transporter substrate-binding protein [Gammaproteobacteria bacterium]